MPNSELEQLVKDRMKGGTPELTTETFTEAQTMTDKIDSIIAELTKLRAELKPASVKPAVPAPPPVTVSGAAAPTHEASKPQTIEGFDQHRFGGWSPAV